MREVEETGRLTDVVPLFDVAAAALLLLATAFPDEEARTAELLTEDVRLTDEVPDVALETAAVFDGDDDATLLRPLLVPVPPLLDTRLVNILSDPAFPRRPYHLSFLWPCPPSVCPGPWCGSHPPYHPQ